MLCPNCGSARLTQLGEYRYNVEYDREILGCTDIVECADCHLLSAYPMPALSSLHAFYESVYRAPGRPHHSEHPHTPTDRHLSYLAYITAQVNLHDVKNVFEVGAGWGETGEVLRTAFPHLAFFTIEPDAHTREALIRRGYTVVESPSDVPAPVQLVISTHSLEHFTNVDDFFSSFVPLLEPGSSLFLEVPNCEWHSGFAERPYDSPHLLFFDSQSLSIAGAARGFEAVIMHTLGHDLAYEFELCREWKAAYGGWQPGVASLPQPPAGRVKSWVKSSLPNRAVEVIQVARRGIPSEPWRGQLFDFALNPPEGWLLRGIFNYVGK